MNEKKEQRGASLTQKKSSVQETSRKVSGEVVTGDVSASEMGNSPDGNIRKTEISISSHQGPIPSPETLAKYKSVDPNIPIQIVEMAKRQQRHSQALEKYVVESEVKAGDKGQTYALIVSMTIILGSLFLIYSGKEIWGGLLVSSTLIGIASIFISGRKKERRDNE